MKIAVIGGGIVGATTAFYLNQQQDNVFLFDDSIGQATSAAAGIISPWLSQRRNQNWYQLAKEGAKFYPTFMKDIGVPTQSDIYQQVGTVLFKNNEQLLKKLTDIATIRKQDAPEIGTIERLTPTELQKKMNILLPHSDSLFISGGARVDGRKLIEHLTNIFQKNGGTYCQEKVQTIAPLGKKWKISTNKNSYEFDKVVLATGAWLPFLLEPLGFHVDIRGQKGQLVHLQISEDTTNWPVIMPQGESDIIPFSNGQILVGATHENEEKYDLTKDQTVIDNMLDTVKTLTPSLVTATQVETRVGTRAYTSDFLPFFGEVRELNGLFVASGLGSSGLTTGPIIGKTIAQWIHHKGTSLQKEQYKPDNYVTKN